MNWLREFDWKGFFVVGGLFAGIVTGVCSIAVIAYDNDKVCVASHMGQIETYPNSGLVALGPSYNNETITPVYSTSQICDRWEKPL